MNPPVVVDALKNGSIPLSVVREDLLPGGTKQRAIAPFLKGVTASQLVYAGPNTGYAQIALAYVGQALGKRVRLFLQGVVPSPLTTRAEAYGAEVTLLETDLATTQATAEKYVSEHPGALLIPFGIEDATYHQYLLEALREATRGMVPPRRVWVAWGSGVLARVLSELWPHAKINAVQVGKGIYIEKLAPELRRRLTIYKATDSYKFFQPIPAEAMPPYPSLATYDGKVWLFKDYMQPYDLIWNVGAD